MAVLPGHEMYFSGVNFADMINFLLKDANFFNSNGTPISGLVPVHKPEPRATSLSIEEMVAVNDASSFTRIDYIFFRRFIDGRSPQIAAYVVDNTDELLSKENLASLHRQVWLHGTAPLLYIAWPSQIDILTCARGADFWHEWTSEEVYSPAQTLRLATTIAGELDTFKRFSAFRLADGTFWEDPRNGELADYAKAAHQSLIQAVVDADTELEGDKNPTLRRLLLLMVLIKYLEDRKVFPDHWFSNFSKGAKTFLDVLQGGEPDEVYRLLSALESKFNGDVFSMPSEGRQRLTKKSLYHFANLVEAKKLGRQRYLWALFSFEHLPVEIISHLYQRFIQDGHGAVYTPPFLASLLLSQAMPYDKLTGDERILDPACGSGVFLVGAFRRMINVWRSRHKWQRPDVNTLKNILKSNIFGVDIDSNAIDLTGFSLCLAICDALKPDVIWKELKFERLRGNNLSQMDFFALLLQSHDNSSTFLSKAFDILIGNPPFESQLTEAGAAIDKDAQQRNKTRGALPDKQAAYLFLEQSLKCLQPAGRICMIQPAGLIYNRNASSFFTYILNTFQIDTILDFTSIRKLYEADPKTIAVCASAVKSSSGHFINHWTFRRTASVNERICFELDHYDRHRFLQKRLEKEANLWRANLLGGGRLTDIAMRFQSMRTLSEYVSEMKWNYGEGYIAAASGKREPASFLTGMTLLPTKAFTESGIDENQLSTVKETMFRSAYDKERFSSPLILFKASETLPVTYWDKRSLAYKDKIIGIHAPQSQASAHKKLYKFIKDNHNAYRFICALNGSQSLVGKATAILKQDIDSLPYPENHADFSFSFWENALCDDVVDYMTEYVRLGQNSRLLKSATDTGTLHEYTTLFIRMLGSVYDNLSAYTPIFLTGLICQPFYFGDRPNLSWLGNKSTLELHKLIYYQNNDHLRTIRVVRLYLDNVLIVIKPDRLRYWIRSTAIRDADDTLVDLRQQGY